MALLRRARCLRRTLLAMRVRRVATVEASTRGWASPPLLVARSRLQRWRGLRPRPGDRGLVLAGSRVHGRRMREPLRLVGVSSDGRVTSSVVLLPGTFRRLDGSAYIIEMPLAAPAPAVGAVLDLLPIVEA